MAKRNSFVREDNFKKLKKKKIKELEKKISELEKRTKKLECIINNLEDNVDDMNCNTVGFYEDYQMEIYD